MKKQLTPAGIYVSRLPKQGVSSIYATAGEAALRLFPLSLEFSRFSDRSKLNCSSRCRQSFSTDDAKIVINFKNCNIVSRFFYFGGKNNTIPANRIVPFHSFLIINKNRKK
ncbi:MAG: hypothetical protein ILA44_01845 [Prevotella sp.]|nr:hypothetical protein [Prevotella sp.]